MSGEVLWAIYKCTCNYVFQYEVVLFRYLLHLHYFTLINGSVVHLQSLPCVRNYCVEVCIQRVQFGYLLECKEKKRPKFMVLAFEKLNFTQAGDCRWNCTEPLPIPPSLRL